MAGCTNAKCLLLWVGPLRYCVVGGGGGGGSMRVRVIHRKKGPLKTDSVYVVCQLVLK